MLNDADATQLAKIFASKMIARPDVKAVQLNNGEYRPVHSKFTLPDLIGHIQGRATYGHYLVNEADQCKMFCFDIDLRKVGMLPVSAAGTGQSFFFQDQPLREYWGSRKPGAGRDFLKLRMKMLANQLASAINKELEIPTAVAYSGSKGVHVYGFTGKTSATLARKGAAIVLEALAYSSTGHWEIERGNNFYKYVSANRADDPDTNYSQFGLEVFPKQDSVEGKEKGLGNLLRLPTGVNLHSPKRDRAFFLDLRTALNDFSPRDAVEALTTSNQWQ